MKPGWIIALVMFWVILVLINAVGEMSFIGTAEASRLYVLLHPDLGNLVSLEWFKNLWGMISFDYPEMFYGTWVIIRYVFWAFTIGIIWGILSTIRGVSSG